MLLHGASLQTVKAMCSTACSAPDPAWQLRGERILRCSTLDSMRPECQAALCGCTCADVLCADSMHAHVSWRSTGGVVASSANGLIVCSNTLDERLRIAYAQTLPDIRTSLFGAVQRA